MTIKNKTTAEHYVWGDKCDGWRLLNQPDLAVTQERIPPQCGEVRHFHSVARQLFYVLSGELEINAKDRVFVLSAGDSLEIAPGAPHEVRNTTQTDVTFLVVSAPSTAADRTNLD